MKESLDILVVERRLVESRTKAQWLIRNGYVLVNDTEVNNPGKRIDNRSEIRLKSEFPYVGRGGLKLEAALQHFSIFVNGKTCADIGSSVGGFVDCLLKRGASKVYAIDTATDLLHPSLMCNNNVVKMLGVDARTLQKLEEKVDLCTIDITFASLKDIIPNVKHFLKLKGDIVALVKPLYETDHVDQSKLNFIKKKEELKEILLKLLDWSVKNDIFPLNLIKSPILGKAGSVEFLIHYRLEKQQTTFDFKKKVREILND